MSRHLAAWYADLKTGQLMHVSGCTCWGDKCAGHTYVRMLGIPGLVRYWPKIKRKGGKS